MKKFKVAIVVVITILFHSNLLAQNATEDKVLGCWKVKSVEFIKSSSNSDEMAKGAKGMITCFDKGGKFTTKFRENNKEIIIGTGKFKIEADGKTINQKRDVDGDDLFCLAVIGVEGGDLIDTVTEVFELWIELKIGAIE